MLDKYYAIYLLDMYHGFAIRDFDRNLQHASEYDSSLFLESQIYWMKVLEECDACETNGYLYDEQDVVTYYRQEVSHYLIEELHLTQEDVDLLYEQYKQIDTPEKRETFEQDMADYVFAVYMKSLQ